MVRSKSASARRKFAEKGIKFTSTPFMLPHCGSITVLLCHKIKIMEQTVDMMRKRHAYFTALIAERGIKTARQFYDELHEWFELFGIELSLNSDGKQCSICIELEYTDYEYYTVIDGDSGDSATISSDVWWNDNYCANSTVNIFEKDKL